MDEFNSKIVTSTLKQAVDILKANRIEYRFFGSVVIAAINGKLHRDLGDLDLIVASSKKDILFTELKKLGYKPARGMFTFSRKYLSLEQLKHPNLLGVGYFYGKWQPDGSFIIGNKKSNLKIDSFAVEATTYKLHGIEFIGIPQRASATGVESSETNPKRKKELILLKERGIQPFSNNYIHISIFGIRADWIYHFLMEMLNIIGAIRIKFGLAFDPWR